MGVRADVPLRLRQTGLSCGAATPLFVSTPRKATTSSEQHSTTAVGKHKPSVASTSCDIAAAAEMCRGRRKAKEKSQDLTTVSPLKQLTGWNRDCVTLPPQQQQHKRRILSHHLLLSGPSPFSLFLNTCTSFARLRKMLPLSQATGQTLARWKKTRSGGVVCLCLCI